MKRYEQNFFSMKLNEYGQWVTYKEVCKRILDLEKTNEHLLQKRYNVILKLNNKLSILSFIFIVSFCINILLVVILLTDTNYENKTDYTPTKNILFFAKR